MMSNYSPTPTRRTSVLTFEEPVMVFINTQHLRQDYDDDVSDDENPMIFWKIYRFSCKSITCTQVAGQRDRAYKWTMNVVFHDANGIDFSSIPVEVPVGWLPRTLLCLISSSIICYQVISVIQDLELGVDICGILREQASEAVRDVHDLLKGTEHDALVQGGPEF